MDSITNVCGECPYGRDVCVQLGCQRGQTVTVPKTIDKLTIHDLFNELHRRLSEGKYDPRHVVPMSDIVTNLDALHHDYTNLTNG